MSNTDRHKGGDRYHLLFDAHCRYCRLFKSAIVLLDFRRNISPVELGSFASEVLLADLEPDLAFKSFHLVDEAANVMSGGDAMPDLISSLCNSDILRRFLHGRSASGLLGRLYAFVSRITSASRCSLGHGSDSPSLVPAELFRNF